MSYDQPKANLEVDNIKTTEHKAMITTHNQDKSMSTIMDLDFYIMILRNGKIDGEKKAP